MRRSASTLVAVVLALGSPALGVPDYGYQWATIGDPGNRATLPEEVPDRPDIQIGSVGYNYRMAITEVTSGQWLEFVRAYQPYYTGSSVNSGFTGFDIINIGGQYILIHNPDAPTEMSWEYAARYCNWLHNGKALTRDAFESGAYDTSTFVIDLDGTFHHQTSHSPGARFWIPTSNEWTKAAHWDPAKDGVGGYWRYPGASDDPLLSGAPNVGGETNGGHNSGPEAVGSYPDVDRPWGLLDTSGGVTEWTETPDQFSNSARVIRSSRRGSAFYASRDAIDAPTFVGGVRNTNGLRIASIVPNPGTLVLCASGLFVPLRRHRFSLLDSSARSS